MLLVQVLAEFVLFQSPLQNIKNMQSTPPLSKLCAYHFNSEYQESTHSIIPLISSAVIQCQNVELLQMTFHKFKYWHLQ